MELAWVGSGSLCQLRVLGKVRSPSKGMRGRRVRTLHSFVENGINVSVVCVTVGFDGKPIAGEK